MADQQQQLSPEEAKLLVKAIEEAEREEADRQQQKSTTRSAEAKPAD